MRPVTRQSMRFLEKYGESQGFVHTHAGERNTESGTVEPSQSVGDVVFGLFLVEVGQVVGVEAFDIGADDHFGESTGGEDVCHDEWEMDACPEHGCEKLAGAVTVVACYETEVYLIRHFDG